MGPGYLCIIQNKKEGNTCLTLLCSSLNEALFAFSEHRGCGNHEQKCKVNLIRFPIPILSSSARRGSLPSKKK